MRRFVLATAAAAVALALAAEGAAHIQLSSPTKRYSDQKAGPCGKGALDARTDNVTYLEPGATITVTWTETVNHPGHFRISFDDDGFDDFVEPVSFEDDGTSPTILLSNIPDDGGTMFSAEVTLPDIECDNCTLQVVQVMTDKPPYEPGTNDLYYQCADLVLQVGAGGGPGATTGAGSTSAGNGVTTGGATGGATSGGEGGASAVSAGNGAPSSGPGGAEAPGTDETAGCSIAASGRGASWASLAFVALALAAAAARRRTA